MLLATVAAHPVRHACVRLCHARNTAEITGVCGHHRDLQSGAGRPPNLFALCLTPCHGAPDTIRYDGSPVCRAFRESLVKRHGCSCRRVDRDERAGDLHEQMEEEEEEVEEDEKQKRLKQIDGATSKHRTIDDRRFWSVASVGDRRGIEEEKEEEELSERSVEMEMDEAWSVEKNATAGNLSPDSPMDEDSMDWDLWCVSQCDNGKGGSACHCDIIP